MTQNLLTNLILIGGGVMRDGETVYIDRWLIEIANKKSKKPCVLFIPAASSDLGEYINDFIKRYTSYGAIVDILLLIKAIPSADLVKRKFLNADLIYFGGGDPLILLKAFRKYSLEDKCKKAIQRGVVICGLSAGAAIWGKEFLNAKWDGSQFVNYKLEKGLGWLNEMVWTHFTDEAVRNSQIVRLLNPDSRILAIGDRVVIYWDKLGQIKALKNTPSDLGLLGEFTRGKLSLQQIRV